MKSSKRRLVVAAQRDNVQMHAAHQFHKRFKHVARLVPAVDIVAKEHDLQPTAVAAVLEILDDPLQHSRNRS
jgi:hypothetical protein